MAATILIVEDEFAVARGIQYALQQEGYQVAVARSGEEGLEFATGQAPVCDEGCEPFACGLAVNLDGEMARGRAPRRGERSRVSGTMPVFWRNVIQASRYGRTRGSTVDSSRSLSSNAHASACRAVPMSRFNSMADRTRLEMAPISSKSTETPTAWNPCSPGGAWKSARTG